MPSFTKISWETFKELPISEKINHFSQNNTMRDILYAQQFSKVQLDEIYALTNKTREISKTSEGKKWLSTLLQGRKAMLYFVQPSTRTFLSFATAAQTLGMSFFDVRSVETSSEIKGESFSDTIRTFSSYFDIIVMRHPMHGYAEKAAFVLNNTPRPIPLINAGSSHDQHPTQALLDIYTLQKSFANNNGLNKKIIMLVGDLKRGRTVRSLCYLLTHFNDIKIILASPTTLRMENDVLYFLKKKNMPTIITNNMHKYLNEVDAIYMTRVQDEYDKPGKKNTTQLNNNFKLLPEHLRKMKKNAIIMHPLPRRNEIHPKIDNDHRAIYWRQVRNGMWTRVALIASRFGLQDTILKA